MHALGQDIRYALRQLRHAPGFALTAIVTLALGIGATIGVYTLVDAVLLRPLPYSDPGRLYALRANAKDGTPAWINYANLLQLADRSQGKISAGVVVTQWNGKIESERLRSAVLVVETTANLPTLLGVQPTLGRSFEMDENLPGKSHVLLLSDNVWRKDFAADPRILGKGVTLGHQPYTVIGVMPRTFAMPMNEVDEVWTPSAITPAQRVTLADDDNSLSVDAAILRAADGVSETQVNAQLANIHGRVLQEHRDLTDLPAQFIATPYLSSLNQSVKRPLLLLLGLSSSFWLLASLNVVSLLIARSIAREREFAVRSALGASRVRLLRQSLVESLLLSAAGSGLGIALATAAIKLLWHPITRSLPLTERIHIAPQIEIVLAAVTLITGMLVGLLPALRASGRNVQNGLRGGAAPLLRAEQHRLRSSLIAVQLMITVILLAGTGLFLRTVAALRSVPLGFSEQNVLTGGIMQPAGIPVIGQKGESGIVERYYLPLLDRLGHMPGVESATMSTVLPMRNEFQVTFQGYLDGNTTKYGAFPVDGRIASTGLPETFGIPMLRGRFFSAEDTPTSPRVVVINQAFAKAYLPNTDPLAHTFGLGKGPVAAMRIVGVLADVKQGQVTEPTKPEVYLCLSQVKPGDSFYEIVTALMQVGIRARIPAQLLRKQFEVALDHVDPDAEPLNVKTIHEAVEDSFGSQTLIAHLLEGFSSMALLIAAVGLYGTVAFSAAQRTREFGVRLALGAPQQSIRHLVVRKAMAPVVAGLLAGDIVLWFAARLVRSYLFGVTPHDATTVVLASLTLLTAAAVAAFIPARRAASIDPMQALRTE